MDRNYKLGVLSGLGAYFLWGILPIYWKLLHEVPPLEILAGRCMWSLAFVAFLIVAMGKLEMFKAEAKEVFSTWKNTLTMVTAALAVSVNWGIFIWAVVWFVDGYRCMYQVLCDERLVCRYRP